MTTFSAKKGYFKNFWKYAGLFHLLYVLSAELIRYLRNDPRTTLYYALPILISFTTICSFCWEKWPEKLIFIDDQKIIQLTYFFLFIKKTVVIKQTDIQYIYQKESVRNNRKSFVLSLFDKDKKIIKIKPNYYWTEENIKRITFEFISRTIPQKK